MTVSFNLVRQYKPIESSKGITKDRAVFAKVYIKICDITIKLQGTTHTKMNSIRNQMRQFTKKKIVLSLF